MNQVILKIILIVTSLGVGMALTCFDFENIFHIWWVSLVLLFLLMAEVSCRNKNYFGIFFISFKAMGYELNQSEKNFCAAVLAFMVSPFLYMLIMAVYEKVAS